MKGASSIVRTLIVDDDATMRFVSKLVLERAKTFQVVAEGVDGLEAIDLASEHKPDLVLLDITMPGMDGFEALPHIRTVSPESVVVVLTGLSGEDVRKRALELGAVAVLEKDPDSKRFLRDLAGILQESGVDVSALDAGSPK